VKLSDFGISKELDNSIAMSNTAVGSYRYMSPERLRGEKYDAAGDIWSVGISVIELWEKAYPFLNIADTPISLLGELERVSFSRILSRSRVGYSKQLKDFLLLTLEPDPAKRLGAADLMSAEWFEVTGVVSLPDAQNVRSYVVDNGQPWEGVLLLRSLCFASQVVAQWLASLHRGTKRGPDNGLGQSGLHQIPRNTSVAAVNAAGRPPRKDANEMSISMDSRSLPAHPQQHVQFHEEPGPVREASQNRLSGSFNPFTSSGSFNFNSSSFSGTNSLTSSSGGVAAFAGGQYGHQAAGPAGNQHFAGHHSSAHTMSRHRMAADIGRGSVPEGNEYEDEKFEMDEDEEVHRYDDSGYSSYDYKQEEKKSAGDGHYRHK
jgi:serine/threonine protein kinase